MADVTKAIQIVTKTGKTILGTKESIKAINHGEVKLVILAANTPSTIRNDILHYAKLSGVPTMEYEGSSLDLGFICGKPFLVSVVSIQEPGDSDILTLVEGNV
jgi:large subunit ribosomal protein L30e